MVNGSKQSIEWFGFEIRSNRVDSVKHGQLSELTRSTLLVNPVDPVKSVKRLNAKIW
ncbi:hypothetical protein Hanom_Chr03g00200371 [Helianthus anomalus]